MSDLISRQAAIDALEKVAELFPWRVPGNRDSYDRYNEAWNDAIGRAEIEIEKLPSAQPEIIHCRECKFASGDSRVCMKSGYSPIGELDFCAWADKEKEDGNTGSN